MRSPSLLLRPRRLPRARAVALLGCAALGATSLAAAGSAGATSDRPDPLASARGHYSVVRSGLDNPRQLTILGNGSALVAEAGHGSSNPNNCTGSGQHTTCIGYTGKVTLLTGRSGRAVPVMSHLLSGAGKDGSFAVGSDGAGKRATGSYFAIETYAPPESFPQGISDRQAGKLLSRGPRGRLRIVANVSRFEINHDVDGEGVDSNPYSLLALQHRVLVADAAGDYIASVRPGHVNVWTVLPEYGPKVDAVPTVISLGGDGNIYVGELHSEQPGKAKVHEYDRHGNMLRTWGGFTTVTGVARTRNGTMYVSELFGGNCSFDQIPSCFPGRVVKIAPNGTRSHIDVPFPAGIDARGSRVIVSAFSVSPATGFGGNPAWSGQVWRLRF